MYGASNWKYLHDVSYLDLLLNIFIIFIIFRPFCLLKLIQLEAFGLLDDRPKLRFEIKMS